MNEPITKFEWERLILLVDIPPMTKLIGLALAVYARRDGGNIHPGQARLAKETGLTDRSVRSHLERLRELGLIERTERGVGNAHMRRADVFRTTIPEDVLDRVEAMRQRDAQEQEMKRKLRSGSSMNRNEDAGSGGEQERGFRFM